MKHFNKNFILITILLSVFLLYGCSHIGLPSKDTSKDKTNSIDQTINSNNGKKNKNPTPSSIQPVANRELTIYSINVENGDIEPATALIPKNETITPELIVGKVTEALEDQSIMVGIQSVTTKDDTVIVNFYKDQAPLKNVGAQYEVAILNAIAQSLIDNLKDYKKVIYRVEGKAYKSGHIVLGMNEIYLGDN